jgi:4'-phosphopantetheinyl transferase EntD
MSRGLAEALDRLGRRLGVSVGLDAIRGAGRGAERDAGAGAAARALAGAGCAEPALLGHEDDGRPSWPAGFTGSIAHADGMAVAAASTRAACHALGIDVERRAALPATDAVAVLDADENASVAAHADPDALATLLWSAKEAAFKAWSTATAGGLGRVDPVDVHVEIDETAGAVEVTARGALRAATEPVGPVRGAFETTSGHLLVLVTAPSRAPSKG